MGRFDIDKTYKEGCSVSWHSLYMALVNEFEVSHPGEYIDEDTNKRAKKKVDVVDPDRVEYTGFARVFDAENMNWDKDASWNMFFLRNVENWANEVLKSKKHIFKIFI